MMLRPSSVCTSPGRTLAQSTSKPLAMLVSLRLMVVLSAIDLIDKTTKEVKQDDDKTVYKSLDEIGEDLPDHSPRFILLSYPMTLVCAPSSPIPCCSWAL